MLSAVAARKARLQSKKQSSTPSTPTPRLSQPSPPPAKTLHDAKPPSKRKPFSQATKSSSSKKRKVNRPREKQGRYFDNLDAFKNQEDVIVVEDDEEDELESSQSEAEGSRNRGKMKGAWLPSDPLQDSSEDEDAELNAEVDLGPDDPGFVQPTRPARQSAVLSTYHPIPDQNLFSVTEEELKTLDLSSTSPGKLLSFAASDRLALIGTYSLVVLHGSVTLSGVALTPSTRAHRIFAPRSSPIPVIECSSLATHLPSQSLDLPPRFQELARSAGAIVLIQELKTGVEGLGRVCRTFDSVFEPSRWQRNQIDVDIGLSSVYYVSYESQDCQPCVLPPSWNSAMSYVTPSVNVEEIDFSRRVYLVKGAKKTGKSTFARTLLNKLTSRYCKVAYLECDLGQSEFTPAGMVALNLVSTPMFGPPFTHPSIPYQSHYIGSTSPRNCPTFYLEAINALVQTYNLDIQHAALEEANTSDPRISDVIPLVVNTMGWTKGLGASLSRKIEEMVDPSALFEFETPILEDAWLPYRINDIEDSNIGASANDGGPKTYSLEPISPEIISTRFSPSDHRTLAILSYFHADLSPPLTQSTSGLHSHYAMSWNTAIPLCMQLPLEITALDALDDVVLLGPGSEDVVPSEVDRVLNGAVVALISCDPGATDRLADDTYIARRTSSIPYMQGTPPPSPSMSVCHGLALVRSLISDGASSSSTHLHILTPLSASVLSELKPRVLVKGEMELPVWGMLDFRSEDSVAGVERNKVPYLKWGKGEGIGSERRRIRRNLMRRGQM